MEALASRKVNEKERSHFLSPIIKIIQQQGETSVSEANPYQEAKIPNPFERPLKAFVCRAMSYMKNPKRKKAEIVWPPALMIAELLNEIVILNPNSESPFTDRDIYNLARGCENYL